MRIYHFLKKPNLWRKWWGIVLIPSLGWGQPKAQRHFDSGSSCWSQWGRTDKILLANSPEQMQMELLGLNCTYNSLQGAFWHSIFINLFNIKCLAVSGSCQLEVATWCDPCVPWAGCRRMQEDVSARARLWGPGAVLSPAGQEPGASVRENAISWDTQQQGRVNLKKRFNFIWDYKRRNWVFIQWFLLTVLTDLCRKIYFNKEVPLWSQGPNVSFSGSWFGLALGN